MKEKEEWTYAWGAKVKTHERHCFRIQKTKKMDPPGRLGWISLCEKHKTMSLGWESAYRRGRERDKSCPKCLRLAKKLGLVVQLH